MPNPLNEAARHTYDLAKQRGVMIATAESCTGGMIAMALTNIPGSSDVVDRGFVTYSNVAKQEMLGVPERMIAENGAVSASVAAAMAEGALKHSAAGAAIGVTGIAGPTGYSETKPVGLVFIAVADRTGNVDVQQFNFGNIGRGAVRELATIEGLKMLSKLLDQPVTG